MSTSLLNNTVEIWYLDKNALALIDYPWESVLSEEELLRANRLHFAKDKEAFVIHHACKRMILANHVNIPPQEVLIATQKKGKPFLQNHPLCFSLSHSHDMAVLAITNDTDIGVDIEYTKKTADFLAIAKRFFHAEEYQQLIDIADSVAQQEYFYLVWTAKEAILKATGEGVSAGLSHFYIKSPAIEKNLLLHTHAKNITLLCLDSPEDYLASLAIIGAQKKVHYHYFTLSSEIGNMR